jgi:hypothetical protein
VAAHLINVSVVGSTPWSTIERQRRRPQRAHSRHLRAVGTHGEPRVIARVGERPAPPTRPAA